MKGLKEVHSSLWFIREDSWREKENNPERDQRRRCLVKIAQIKPMSWVWCGEESYSKGEKRKNFWASRTLGRNQFLVTESQTSPSGIIAVAVMQEKV